MATPTTVIMTWTSPDSVLVTRRVEVSDSRLTVDTTHVNRSSRPVDAAHVEHLILGEALLTRGAHIELPRAAVIPLTDDGRRMEGVAQPDLRGAGWADVPNTPTRRFAGLVNVEPRLVVVHPSPTSTVTVRWHGLPHLWYWLELDSEPDPPWSGRVKCLGLEPASVAASDGLAARAASHDAWRLAPGQVKRVSVELVVSEA